MKRRLLSILLALALCLGLAPGGAWAAESGGPQAPGQPSYTPGTVAIVTANGSTTECTDIEDAWTEAQKSGPATITLVKNTAITGQSELKVETGHDITLKWDNAYVLGVSLISSKAAS